VGAPEDDRAPPRHRFNSLTRPNALCSGRFDGIAPEYDPEVGGHPERAYQVVAARLAAALRGRDPDGQECGSLLSELRSGGRPRPRMDRLVQRDHDARIGSPIIRPHPGAAGAGHGYCQQGGDDRSHDLTTPGG
jgi:hypothetical protein